MLELAIGHVADVVQLAQERGLDGGVLPHREEHRRPGLIVDVVADLEGSALAHRGADVEEGIGPAKLAQPVAAEVPWAEGKSLAPLQGVPERLVGQRRVSGEVLERHPASGDLVHDPEHTFHDLPPNWQCAGARVET
jgi:hypothetical protein